MSRLRLGSLVGLFLVMGANRAFPQEWMQYEQPEDVGFDTAKLEEVRTLAQKAGSTAVFVAYRGQVVCAWGQVDRVVELYSVRKSLVSALYGVFVGAGTMDIRNSLADLQLDDLQPLSDVEKGATIADLLRARSGVYHPAAKEPSDMKAERPARGSHRPGEHFWYNNWDFNVAGVALERVVGKNLAALFEKSLAVPLGMQDFHTDHIFEQLEPRQSIHPAHAFRMSARDLARIGQLFLQNGAWNKQKILPESWIAESTKIHSSVDKVGYGYMWWVYPPGALGADSGLIQLDRFGKFAARGTGGQFLLVIPDAHLVYVHLTDTEYGKAVQGPLVWRICEAVLAAKTGEEKPTPSLKKLAPVPFKTPLPDPPIRTAIKLEGKILERFEGEYEGEGGMAVSVYRWNDRLFAVLKNEGEAELFAESETVFFARAGGARVSFRSNDASEVIGADVEYRGRNIQMQRKAP